MPKKKTVANQPPKQHGKDFHIELLNGAQKLAWAAFQQHDVLFLIGPAGCGKTFLSCAFAVKELLSKSKSKIVLTRPIVEAGESLGYLPGDFYEKVNPYMMPMYDCLDKLVGKEGTPLRERIMGDIEIAPLAFMRGRTFDDAVCLLDEAQNCSMQQLKLFMTRFGENSKITITGDPNQSDLRGNVALIQAVRKLRNVNGIGVVEFKNNSIVRHPLVGSILDALAEEGEVNHSYTPVFDDPETVEADEDEGDVPSYFPKRMRDID